MNRDAQRYNLIFAGELLPGTHREQAQRVLAGFFGLKDPAAVAVFFSGKPVPLRRQLKREDALKLYRQLRSVGLICDLQAVAAATPTTATAQRKDPTESTATSTPKRSSTDSSPDTGPTVRSADAPPDPPPRPQRPVPGPNVFALRPTPGPARGSNPRETAQLRFFIASFVAVALCLLVITLTLRFPGEELGSAPAGPIDAATLPDNGLVLMTEDALLLHERSGLARQRITARELGLTTLAPPLWIGSDGMLLVNGGAALQAGIQLQRCDLDERICAPFLQDASAVQVIAIAASYLGDAIFLLTDKGELLRSDAAGRIVANATVLRPWGRDRVIAADGLLLLPAPDSPLLGVYRPDAGRFAQQLDALLLMPPQAAGAAQDRIVDLAVSDQARHALLGGETAPTALYQFDARWGTGQPLALPGDFTAEFLVPWRDRVLVANSAEPLMLRYGPDGHREADFTSTLLVDARERWEQQRLQQQLLRQLGIALPLFLATLCAGLALLYGAESRALGLMPNLRTALLDPMPAGITWVAPGDTRRRALTRLGLSLLGVAVLAMLVVTWLQGALPALSFAPAVLASAMAWHLFNQGAGGHLGYFDQRVILVDYDGRYFYGETSHLRGTRSCLLAPGVALPLSMGGLINLRAHTLTATDAPLAPGPMGGADVLGMLWHLDHPWLRAGLFLGLGWFMSISILVLLTL